MKHTIRVTALMVILFLITQIVGLLLTYVSFAHGLPFNIDRPDVNQDISFIYIIAGVLIGTVLILLLIKFRRPGIWKVWFMVSVILTLTIAFSMLVNPYIALLAAIAFAYWKIFHGNIYIHNFTEIFIYSGIGIILIPIMNISSAIILLILISLYDMYAVWKSKHMVKMAEFIKDTNVFAGLSVPYEERTGKILFKQHNSHKDHRKITALHTRSAKGKSIAILGGGDMAFPLLFAGTIMMSFGMLSAIIVSVVTSIALLLLFAMSSKGKYYPAMPFISVGCLVGFGIVYLISLL